MLRRLHSLPGLIFGLVLLVMASSGAMLSLAPMLDRVQAPVVAGLSVAEVAAKAAVANPGLTALHRCAFHSSPQAWGGVHMKKTQSVPWRTKQELAARNGAIR